MKLFDMAGMRDILDAEETLAMTGRNPVASKK